MPSRHIPLHEIVVLKDAVERLHAANDVGWGAYYSLATRQAGLSRWQRGGLSSLVQVPAIIADLDEAPDIALPRVQAFSIQPSLIVSSGHGLHVYWLLYQPASDVQAVNAIHRGITLAIQGDYLTAVTALRLPGTLNTKRNLIASCEVLHGDWSRRYSLEDFTPYQLEVPCQPRKESTQSPSHQAQKNRTTLDPRRIQCVANVLLSRGYKWRDTWLNGTCPYAHRHKHTDTSPSFGFNTATGYGYCFVCGSMLLKDLCLELNVHSSLTVAK